MNRRAAGMSSTERRIRIMEMLYDGITAEMAAQALGVSDRTVYRDVGWMRMNGATISGERGVGYFFPSSQWRRFTGSRQEQEMKFTNAIEEFLTVRDEHTKLRAQVPQNMELIVNSEKKLQEARASLADAFRLSTISVTAHDRRRAMERAVSRAGMAAGSPEALDRLMAERIREVMDAGQMGMDDFANLSGLSIQTVKRLLDVTDGMTVTMETARKLKQVTGMCVCCGHVDEA